MIILSGAPPDTIVFVFIVIFGGFVLPTVLIGIVTISFDEASRRGRELAAISSSMNEMLAAAQLHLPDFFTVIVTQLVPIYVLNHSREPAHVLMNLMVSSIPLGIMLGGKELMV